MITRSSLIESLTNIVKSDKNRWKSESFERAVSAAIVTLSRDKPLLDTAELVLIAGQRRYALPSDALAYISSDWGRDSQLEAWDTMYPGVMPRIYNERRKSGSQITFSVSPSSKHIAAYGSRFVYEYSVLHEITEELNTIATEDEELFFTAALIVLIQELVAANVSTPIQLHRGMGSTPSNSTPVATHRALVLRYKELLQC